MERIDRERKKAFLRSYLKLKRGCRALEAAIEELRAGVILPAKPMTGMPRGGEPAGLEGYIDAVREKERELDEKRLAMVAAYDRVESAIWKMPAGYEREILQRRYLAGEKWEAIADELHLDVRSVYRYHGYALSSFQLPEGK